MTVLKSILSFFLIVTISNIFAQQKEIPVATAKENTFKVVVDFHCPNGKVRLEKGLMEYKGVQSVDADLKTKVVTVVHNSEEITTKAIVKAVETIGHRTEYTAAETKIKSACSHGHDHDHDHDHNHPH